jgi:hypothetical protein
MAPSEELTRSGRRNLWLRALDTAGMGYDS